MSRTFLQKNCFFLHFFNNRSFQNEGYFVSSLIIRVCIQCTNWVCRHLPRNSPVYFRVFHVSQEDFAAFLRTIRAIFLLPVHGLYPTFLDNSRDLRSFNSCEYINFFINLQCILKVLFCLNKVIEFYTNAAQV